MTKISKNREKKESIVAELSDKVVKAKAVVFTDYKGMTHKQIEDLKKALRPSNAELVVTKNTLLKIALEKNKKNVSLDEVFQNPTATLFAYTDIVAPIKEIAKIIKSLKLPVIKGGILENSILKADDIIKLSTLPSRETLIAQVVGGMKSPIYGLHRALNWNIQKLVLTLNAIQAKKQ